MPTTIKILGQVNPAATTETQLYASTGVTAAVSSIVVCNQAGTSATYRIAVVDSTSGSAAAKNWIVYGATVPASDTVVIPAGITMAASQQIRVFASTANLSFSAFGTEIS